MKMKRVAGFTLLTLGILLAGFDLAADSIYGHISYVDNEALVIRADGSESRAMVNLPLVPGDTLVTSTAGRCELQFDNGTVVRLDKDSRLRITTVLAPSLTSKWKITTLELLRGQMYSLPQTYHGEMFQVVTPAATIKLKARTAATFRLDAGGGASFFCDSGRFDLLYGAEGGSLRKAKVKAGQAYAISPANELSDHPEARGTEFIAWNEYVNRHFKELHYAVNKVPVNLSRFKNKALVLWAEKWSSLFGEWVYDDLFGYVWKPADEQFALAGRPFFHADIVRIDGQMFLVPQQAWGWVPAHLGTWVWLKNGWTWIPGEWFHPGIVHFQGHTVFPSLNYFLWLAYGNYDLFHIYCYDGPEAWRLAYLKIFKREIKKPDLTLLPPRVEKVLRLARKLPDAGKRLGLDRSLPIMDAAGPVSSAPPPASPAPVRDRLAAVTDKAGEGGHALARDWNPDRRWAARNGYSIHYSSSVNSVLCPELKLSSSRLRGAERMILRESILQQGVSSPAAAQAPSGLNPADPAKSNPAQNEAAQPGKQDDKDGKGK
jgi:hypothetical protein